MSPANTRLSLVLAAVPALLLGGCATSAVVKPTVSRSDPRAVDPRADAVNLLTLQQSTPALLVAVRIDDQRVTLAGAELARVPRKPPAAPRDGDTVTLTALAAGQPVGTVTVADQLVNAQEGGGIVLVKDRTIHAAVPVERRADAVEVRVSAGNLSARLPVEPRVYRACEGAPDEPFCAKGR